MTTTRSFEAAKMMKHWQLVTSNVESVAKMAQTLEEWWSAGLDNAAIAELADELSEKLTWID